MRRRAALQVSLTSLATVLAPSLAFGSAIEVPDEDHVVVDWDGEITFVGDWDYEEAGFEDGLRAEVEMLRTDPDYHVFANFPIVCRDPELQTRVIILLGAGAAEVDAERERWDRENLAALQTVESKIT